MQRLILLIVRLLPVLISSVARAEKRVTVAQLKHMLHADVEAHTSDVVVMRQLAGAELTEQLTESTLDRLAGQLRPGSQAVIALQLADKPVG